jgi:hypothetical protein
LVVVSGSSIGFGAGSSAVMPVSVGAGAACARTRVVPLLRLLSEAAEVAAGVVEGGGVVVARGEAEAAGAVAFFFADLFFEDEFLSDLSFEPESLAEPEFAPEPVPCEPVPEPLPPVVLPPEVVPPLPEPLPDSEPEATGVVLPPEWSFLLEAAAGPAVTTARTSTANSAVRMRRTTRTPFCAGLHGRFG